MADCFVSKAKLAQLEIRLRGLGIRADQLVEKFILGAGRGGQKLNKTASCVYLRHVPSGIEIKCRQSRSRELNRFLARRELCDQLEARIQGIASARRQEWERTRRQKRRRSRRQKEHMLAAKHHQTEKKALRQAPGME